MTSGPTSHRYVSQRLKLNYVAWGDPDSPPLLLVHGGRDHCRSWDWTAEALKDDWYVIAPDLRGHGDSDWDPSGNYAMTSFVYDIAQLVHQLDLAPLRIVAHSMGGNISTRYAGLFPEMIEKLVVIEGLGWSPKRLEERAKTAADERLRQWIVRKRSAAARQPKRYASLREAYERMKAENTYLSDEQAKHLTIHGTSQNEDGSYSWKFDNYLHVWWPEDMPTEEFYTLWENITCPTLLLYGKDSWASSPAGDGRLQYFSNATLKEYENAAHWLHHDQFDRFIADLKAFL